MQIRALAYFDALVRTGSMRQAADLLGVAPTAVSRQVENLEHHFGARLVERSTRGVTLTAAGELLAAHAGRTLRDLAHVQRLIDDLKGLQRGHVVVFAGGAVVTNLLAPALAAFARRYPRLRFEVEVTTARRALEALVSAEADIALTLFAPSMPGTRNRLRATVVYDAIMAADHPLAAQATIPLSRLADYPLVMPDAAFGARQAFDRVFAREKVAVDPTFLTGSLEMQKELVMRGAAVALLPGLCVERERQAGAIAVRPIEAGKAVRADVDLSVAQDRQLSFAAGKLLDGLERAMRDMV